MLDCQNVEGAFFDLVEGELTPQRRAEVQAHLAGCAGCAAALGGYRRVIELGRSLPRCDPPHRVLRRLRRLIDVRLRLI